MHLWSPRRNKLNAVKRSMSSPTTALVTSTPPANPPPPQSSLMVEDPEHPIHAEEQEEGESRSYADVAKDGVSAARDALLGTGSSFGGSAFGRKEKKEEDGWAPNLFYAYARRTNLPNSSRYILTFSSAKTCQEWWTLVQAEFGGPPSNTRESAQLFSFSGDDMPGRAWKNPRFEKLKTKWFYTQLGDAVGTNGRGMEVLPLQDEKGWAVGHAPLSNDKVTGDESAVQRRASSVESLADAKGKVNERRRSKRDSGIILMSPFSEHFKNTEEETKAQKPEEQTKVFDFERMETNLEKVEKLMEQNAKQMKSLEHVQAANIERLTAALQQNAEMVQELAKGQLVMVGACEELRQVVNQREEAVNQREKADRAKRMVEKKEDRERKLMSDREEREKRSRSKETERQHLTRSQSVMSTATHDTIETLSPCGHVVRRAPRKLGRQVVGYIYANDEHEEVAQLGQQKRRTKG